jgi:hypothetical protein
VLQTFPYPLTPRRFCPGLHRCDSPGSQSHRARSCGIIVYKQWEAVDDRDSDKPARNLNVAGNVADQRRQRVRERRYHPKVLEQGR